MELDVDTANPLPLDAGVSHMDWERTIRAFLAHGAGARRRARAISESQRQIVRNFRLGPRAPRLRQRPQTKPLQQCQTRKIPYAIPLPLDGGGLGRGEK